MENTSIQTAEQQQLPEPLSDALFDSKLTQKQRKFVILLTHYEGTKSASQCAFEAGYSRRRAKVTAAELKNPKMYPEVAKAIEEEERAHIEKYKVTKERHLSIMARLRDAAATAGNFNAAVAAETRRGQVAGYYIDKKEIKTGSIDQMSREETEAKLKEIMQQFSIDGDYEELLEIENKS